MMVASAAASSSPTRPILANDLIEITVFDAPEMSRAARVGSDGNLSIPLVGTIKAAGLTSGELQAEIESRLRGKYMVDPHVAIDVKEASIRPFYVLGAVKAPGAFPMDDSQPVTVLRALSLGQGLANAKGRAFIIRSLQNGERLEIPVEIDDVIAGKAPDPQLQANDIVYVPENEARSLARGVVDGLLRVVGRGVF
jgi:polysaccharide export outer membrane protein